MIYNLTDPAHPVFIRDWALDGQQPGGTPPPHYTAVPSIHGPISTGPGKRVYFAYGTSSNGAMQIVDRDKLFTTSPTDYKSAELGLLDMSPTWGAHTSFPIGKIAVTDWAANTENVRDFVVVTSEETYLRGGHFSMEGMLTQIQEALEAGARLGFPLTRLLGHPELVLEDLSGVNLSGVNEFIEYEMRLNDVLPSYDDPVICLYDTNLLNGTLAVDILRTHPVAIIGGLLYENPFFVPPQEFLRQVLQRSGAQVTLGDLRIEGALAQGFFALANDLISVLALPAMWGGKEAAQIVCTLLDVLVACCVWTLPMRNSRIRLMKSPLRWSASRSRGIH